MARWVSCNKEKRHLPGQPGSHESVEKSGMRDRRWITPADQSKHEVERGDNQYAPNARNPKHNLGKFHGGSASHDPNFEHSRNSIERWPLQSVHSPANWSAGAPA